MTAFELTASIGKFVSTEIDVWSASVFVFYSINEEVASTLLVRLRLF